MIAIGALVVLVLIALLIWKWFNRDSGNPRF